jgi:hypothetical protein
LRRSTCFLVLFALTSLAQVAPAQDLSTSEKKQLVDRINSSYYNLAAHGFKGMQCSMIADWPPFVNSLPGPQKNAHLPDNLKRLNAIASTVTVDAKGHADITFHIPDQTEKSDFGPEANQMTKGMAASVEGFFAAWAPFTIQKPFPPSTDSLDLKPTIDGYEMTQHLSSGTVTSKFAKDLALKETFVKTDSMSVQSRLQFQSSPSGFLLTSVKSEISMEPSGKMPETVMNISYAPVGGMQLPQNISIAIGMGSVPVIKVALTGCKLTE